MTELSISMHGACRRHLLLARAGANKATSALLEGCSALELLDVDRSSLSEHRESMEAMLPHQSGAGRAACLGVAALCALRAHGRLQLGEARAAVSQCGLAHALRLLQLRPQEPFARVLVALSVHASVAACVEAHALTTGFLHPLACIDCGLPAVRPVTSPDGTTRCAECGVVQSVARNGVVVRFGERAPVCTALQQVVELAFPGVSTPHQVSPAALIEGPLVAWTRGSDAAADFGALLEHDAQGCRREASLAVAMRLAAQPGLARLRGPGADVAVDSAVLAALVRSLACGAQWELVAADVRAQCMDSLQLVDRPVSQPRAMHASVRMPAAVAGASATGNSAAASGRGTGQAVDPAVACEVLDWIRGVVAAHAWVDDLMRGTPWGRDGPLAGSALTSSALSTGILRRSVGMLVSLIGRVADGALATMDEGSTLNLGSASGAALLLLAPYPNRLTLETLPAALGACLNAGVDHVYNAMREFADKSRLGVASDMDATGGESVASASPVEQAVNSRKRPRMASSGPTASASASAAAVSSGRRSGRSAAVRGEAAVMQTAGAGVGSGAGAGGAWSYPTFGQDGPANPLPVPLSTLGDALDCPLCFALFHAPVSLSCGHSFCRDCVVRVADHTPKCPTCRAPFSSAFGEQRFAVNIQLERICYGAFPATYAARVAEAVKDRQEAEKTLALFVCNLTLPVTRFTLHVFEPRYRLMIRRALQSGTNRFGMVVHLDPEDASPANVALIQTAVTAPGVGVADTAFAPVGVTVRILRHRSTEDGRTFLDCVAEERRFVVQSSRLRDGYVNATVAPLEDTESVGALRSNVSARSLLASLLACSDALSYLMLTPNAGLAAVFDEYAPASNTPRAARLRNFTTGCVKMKTQLEEADSSCVDEEEDATLPGARTMPLINPLIRAPVAALLESPAPAAPDASAGGDGGDACPSASASSDVAAATTFVWALISVLPLSHLAQMRYLASPSLLSRMQNVQQALKGPTDIVPPASQERAYRTWAVRWSCELGSRFVQGGQGGAGGGGGIPAGLLQELAQNLVQQLNAQPNAQTNVHIAGGPGNCPVQ
jgi:Lon protease-like protein